MEALKRNVKRSLNDQELELVSEKSSEGLLLREGDKNSKLDSSSESGDGVQDAYSY